MADKLQRIHETALKILQGVGIQVFHPEVIGLLQQKGVKVSGNTVFFDPTRIMEWVQKAPCQFTLHAGNSDYTVTIGGDRVECAPGYGSPMIIHMDGTFRKAALHDYIRFAKLVHGCGLFRINGGVLVVPCDIPPDHAHLAMMAAALTLSDKCLMGVAGAGRIPEQVMELVAIAFGGRDALAAKPRVLTMISPISPLQLDRANLNAMRVAARYRQPLIVSPCPAAGMTGPIQLAGNLAMATAEALATIAISQMIQEGLPVIFGLQNHGADLKTGSTSFGSPAHALQIKYGARLARFYNLPSRGGGAVNDAKAVSVQSGYESMMSMLTTYENRVNLIVHAAGILDSFLGMSYEQFMVDIDIIRMIQFYADDIAVDDETLSFDVIQSVGPGGQFLTAPDTLTKCRTHSWNPDIGLRGFLAGELPQERLLKNINDTMQQLLQNYQKPAMDPRVLKQMADYLSRAGMDESVIRSILFPP